MKPLELVVYRTLEDFGVVFGYDTPEVHATSEADAMAAAKRFTDTELAAEYQFSRYFAWVRVGRTKNSPQTDAAWNAYQGTFHRFATLPHYDEVTA